MPELLHHPLAGFLYKSYDCLRKFLSCPQGIQTSTQHQTKVDFPDLTFCPKFLYDSQFNVNQKVSPYNWSVIKECGIELTGKFHSVKCPNVKELWLNLTPKLEDFGFEEGSLIKYLDRSWEELNINKNTMFREISYFMGTCYTLKVPKNMTEKGVFLIYFKLKLDHFLHVFVHPPGLFNLMDPWRSPEFIVNNLQPNLGYNLLINYQQNHALDFDGKNCESNKSYNFMKCVQEKVFQVSFF